MEGLHDFFAASVGAAAGLIGLLFVAISLDPGKVFSPDADAKQRADASGAFTALANVFFVSLAALVPLSPGTVILVVACLSMLQIIVEGNRMAERYPEMRGRRRYGIISICIFVLEAYIAGRLSFAHGSPEGLVYVVFGLYGYALGNSWTLLGARSWRPRR